MYKLLPILLFAYGLALTTEDIYDNSYALIIGIDKYENVRSLDYAVKDAEDIQSMLVDKFHFQQDNIVLLKDEEATKTTIIQEFSNITKKAGDNDRVLIFFAGHGETQDLPDGGELGYLMPVNGDGSDLYVSAIGMEELRKISLISEAKHILYLIDACYGGIASIGARGLDAESTPDYLQKITQYKSRQIISAGGRGEQVIERAEWGHSAFTKNLLSGLRDSKADTDSDGIITAQELGTYLKKKVTIDSDNKQTPKTRNLSSDEGEFVFVYAENAAVIQDKSTDAKLDYLISKIEALETQSTADKTKPDLNVNPDLKQSDYPLLVSFIFYDQTIMLMAGKQQDERTTFGLGYARFAWKGKSIAEFINHPSYGDSISYTEHVIFPIFGYLLLSKSILFNPAVSFSVGVKYKKIENYSRHKSNDALDYSYSIALLNRIKMYKNNGITFGIVFNNTSFHDFNENNFLVVLERGHDYVPFVTIDIAIPFSKKKD